jgi:hypothetical protein
MVDGDQADFNVGLSDEERDDLEKLINIFKGDGSTILPDASFEDVQDQIRFITEQLAVLSEMLLKFDTRMKSFYEIIRLSHQKTENMNEQIHTIIQFIKKEKNLQSGS